MKKKTLFCVLLLLGLLFISTGLTSNSYISAQSDTEYTEANPVWAPDGYHIAFKAISLTDYNKTYGQPLDEYNWDIWIMNSDGTNRGNLTADSPFYDADPVWSPDGNAIAFASNRSGYMDVWVMRVDGTNPINLTSADLNDDGGYKWSPDGRFIAYLAENIRAVSYDIWIVEPDGTNPVRITSGGNHLYGSITWAPDSQTIAFTDVVIDSDVSDLSQSLDPEKFHPTGVWKISIDGTGLTPLTSNRRDMEVAWSPTGDLLATVVLDGLDTHLWLISPDGSTLMNLGAITPDIDHYPVWSPVGNRLAFISRREGILNSWDVWVIDADGADPVNLTSNIGFVNIAPSWSPDGAQIVFESYLADNSRLGFDVNSDIWVIDADGTDPRNLTDD